MTFLKVFNFLTTTTLPTPLQFVFFWKHIEMFGNLLWITFLWSSWQPHGCILPHCLLIAARSCRLCLHVAPCSLALLHSHGAKRGGSGGSWSSGRVGGTLLLGMHIAWEFPLYQPSFCRERVWRERHLKGKGPDPQTGNEFVYPHITLLVFEKPEIWVASWHTVRWRCVGAVPGEGVAALWNWIVNI